MKPFFILGSWIDLDQVQLVGSLQYREQAAVKTELFRGQPGFHATAASDYRCVVDIPEEAQADFYLLLAFRSERLSFTAGSQAKIADAREVRGAYQYLLQAWMGEMTSGDVKRYNNEAQKRWDAS